MKQRTALSHHSAVEYADVPSEHIQRSRLSELMKQSPRPVLWLMGPLGSGKSALAREYSRLSGQKLTWYRFERGEPDAGRLLEKIRLDISNDNYNQQLSLAQLSSDDDAGNKAGVTTDTTLELFKSVAESYDQPWILCLDGYELLDVESELHGVLADIAACAGDLSLTMIVTSRVRAPQQWSSIMANRQLEVFSDFNFDREELSRVVAAYPAFEKRSDAWLQGVFDLSAGWPAGVALLLEHLRLDLEQNLKDASLQATSGFFQHRFFSTLPEGVSQLLLRASLLPILPVDRVVEILEQPEAMNIFNQLCDEHTFTSRKKRVPDVSGEAQQPYVVYSHQPMFLAFLRQRAEAELSVQERRAVAIRGAEQLALNNDFMAAVALYAEYGCLDEIVTLILANALSLAQSGQASRLESAFSHLPSAVIEASPDLLLWRGIGATSLGDSSARLHLSQAYGLYRDQANAIGMALSWRAVVDAIWLSWDGLDELGVWLAEYDVRADTEFNKLPDPLQTGMMMSRFGILSFWSPEHADLPELEDRIVEYVHGPMSIQERALLFVKILHHFTYGTGNRAQTDFYLNVMRTYMNQAASTPLDRILLDNFEAAYQYCFEGSPQSCYDFVDSALTAGDDASIEIWHSVSLTHGLYMALGQGDIKRAKTYLTRFKAVIGLNNFMHVAFDELFSAWLAMLEGRHSSAIKHIEAGLIFFERNPVPMIRNLFLGGKAALLIQQGEWKTAWSVLTEIRKFARSARSNTFEIMVRMLQARWCLERRRHSGARAFLQRARDIGVEQNIFVCPWLAPEQLPKLVGLAIESNIDQAYFSRWVSLYSLKVPSGYTARDRWPWRIRIRTLGALEISLEGEVHDSQGRARKRSLEIMGVLISAGPKGASQNQLIGELWPDKSEERARSNLNTNLARLRGFLGEPAAVISSEGMVYLNSDICWVDSWELLRGTEANESMDITRLAAAEDLYRGTYAVPETVGGAELIQSRTLVNRYFRVATLLAMALREKESFDNAIDVYRNMLEKLGPDEAIYCELMACYADMNRPKDVSAIYKECEKILADKYDTSPSSNTRNCYQKLLEQAG